MNCCINAIHIFETDFMVWWWFSYKLFLTSTLVSCASVFMYMNSGCVQTFTVVFLRLERYSYFCGIIRNFSFLQFGLFSKIVVTRCFHTGRHRVFFFNQCYKNSTIFVAVTCIITYVCIFLLIPIFKFEPNRTWLILFTSLPSLCIFFAFLYVKATCFV